MQDKDIAALAAAIAALESQRATLGDAVLELAVAPLRARLAGLRRPAGLQLRQVTVLFADVVGSTAMAGRLGAEATLDVLSGALHRMADLVEAHGGRVLRFTGDGVKAAFGMDAAREDDPDRAVRAGLAILQAGREQAEAARLAHGIADFAVRVGVHTGDVALGAGLEADNTAMGMTVNIAARMEQSAPVGGLRISHDTFGQVRGLFDVEAQPPLQVKGVEAPMSTYLVLAALDRSTASVERGLQGVAIPMVGRHAELQRLLDAVARVDASRRLQAVTLVGDAGLGKSRLLRELVARSPHGRVIGVRSLPDGVLRPWGLLRSLLAVQFGVADTDSAEVARRKVEQGLGPWFDTAPEGRAARQAQLVGQLSGLDFGDSPHLRGLDPQALRDQGFAALLAYLQALARDRGVVLLIEDLHWADDGSLDLLEYLLANAADLPLALIMTARPGLLTRRPQWMAADALVRLAPLAAAQSDEMAQALLQRLDAVPLELSRLIVDQAEGNPYYVEELVRRLIDDGVIGVDGPRWTLNGDRLRRLRLPGTLVGLLQTRLDSLPALERQAARQASVIGHVFWDQALQAVDDQAPKALAALQRAAFVKAHDSSDFEGTAQRQFDHHLLHQVTYGTLLKAERHQGHGAVARWLGARTQGRGAEFLAMTGDHAERAGETALAIDCFEQAATEAQKRFANSAAVSWRRRALALLGDAQPERRFDLLNALEMTADVLGDRPAQEALHGEMATLLQGHPDDSRQARLWHVRAMLADRLGDRVTSAKHCEQACRLAERCEAAATAALSHGLQVWLHIADNEYESARDHVEPSLRWAGKIEPESERSPVEARLLTLSAMVSIRLSRYAEARATLLDVVARGEALGAPRVQLGAMDNLVVLETEFCRGHDVVRWGERMLALAEASGDRPYILSAHWRLIDGFELLEDDPAIVHWGERTLPLARALGDQRTEACALRSLAHSRRRQKDLPAALTLFQQARTVFDAADMQMQVWECTASAATCELALGRGDAALASVEATLAALRSTALSHWRGAQTVGMRWNSFEVLEALGDARASPLIAELQADVQSEIAQMATPAERDHLLQTLPTFSAVLEAHRRLTDAGDEAS